MHWHQRSLVFMAIISLVLSIIWRNDPVFLAWSGNAAIVYAILATIRPEGS